jgi:hypothetical protein
MIQLLDSSDGDSAARATRLIRQREQPAFRQMLFDRLFTWPADQPRHATDTYGDPVKSNRPLFLWVVLRQACLEQVGQGHTPILSASRGASIGNKSPDFGVESASGPLGLKKCPDLTFLGRKSFGSCALNRVLSEDCFVELRAGRNSGGNSFPSSGNPFPPRREILSHRTCVIRSTFRT